MKLLLSILLLTLLHIGYADAQTQKPKDTLNPKCEQREKAAQSNCRERRLKGSELQKCLERAKYGAHEVLVLSGKNKKESRTCEREESMKKKYGEKCISECPRGVAVLSRTLVQSGINVKKCRDEKSENFVVACRQDEEKKKEKCSGSDLDVNCTSKNMPKTQEEKDKLKRAEERALGGNAHTTTHYDCKGMGRSTTCYGVDGVIRTQEDRDLKRLRDGDIAIPLSFKKSHDLNFGDRVLLEHTTPSGEVRRAWATVRDINAAPTIDFFREVPPGSQRAVRESTPMQQLGFTYGTTYGDRSRVRIVEVDRSGRFYFK